MSLKEQVFCKGSANVVVILVTTQCPAACLAAHRSSLSNPWCSYQLQETTISSPNMRDLNREIQILQPGHTRSIAREFFISTSIGFIVFPLFRATSLSPLAAQCIVDTCRVPTKPICIVYKLRRVASTSVTALSTRHSQPKVRTTQIVR